MLAAGKKSLIDCKSVTQSAVWIVGSHFFLFLIQLCLTERDRWNESVPPTSDKIVQVTPPGKITAVKFRCTTYSR